jgi:hypothetical protein
MIRTGESSHRTRRPVYADMPDMAIWQGLSELYRISNENPAAQVCLGTRGPFGSAFSPRPESVTSLPVLNWLRM